MAVRLGVVVFAFGFGAGASLARAAIPLLAGGPTALEVLDAFGWTFCAVLCVFYSFMLSKLYSGEW